MTESNPAGLTGQMIIGGTLVTGTGEPVYGVDPRTGDRLEPGYRGAGPDDLDRACQLAEQAFEGYRSAPIAASALPIRPRRRDVGVRRCSPNGLSPVCDGCTSRRPDEDGGATGTGVDSESSLWSIHPLWQGG